MSGDCNTPEASTSCAVRRGSQESLDPPPAPNSTALSLLLRALRNGGGLVTHCCHSSRNLLVVVRLIRPGVTSVSDHGLGVL
jgi:hypothetical protein